MFYYRNSAKIFPSSYSSTLIHQKKIIYIPYFVFIPQIQWIIDIVQ